MSMLLEYLHSIPAGAALGWIIAIFSACACIYSWAQKYRKVKNKYDDTQKATQINTKNISLLSDQVHQAENLFLDQVSKLNKKDVVIDEKINYILESLQDLDKYQKNKDMNDLRDRINRNYRNYKSRAKHNNGIVFITKNQLEAFEGLINAYTAADGNSFVHSQILPQIMNWEVLSEEEVAKKLGER